MPTLWIFDIEPHEQRYTSEWQKYLPQQIANSISGRRSNNWNVEVVDTIPTSGKLTKGAFLNFAETNVYKSYQMAAFSKWVEDKKVKQGDRILFTDAWHPGVIQCRYMSNLLDLKLTIDVMWHAGGYDKYDLLSRRSRRDPFWCQSFERAVFDASDMNYFATEYHKDLFIRKINPNKPNTARIVGWPMEYLVDLLKGREQHKTKDVILFPHRMSPEKQPGILRKLKPMLTQYKIVFAQDLPLSKVKYHDLLSRSIACFSASKQETLGIGTYEAMLCGAIPIVPNRLSYKEIYDDICYPTIWTKSQAKAKQFTPSIVAHINNMQDAYSPLTMHHMALNIGKKYFDGGKLYASLLR